MADPLQPGAGPGPGTVPDAPAPARPGPGAPGGPARLTVLSGPSGVGKSTVVRWLHQHCPQIWQSVSVTTRAPRPGETSGREYFFASEAEFTRLAAAGELLEWARFAGHLYGTPQAPVAEHLAAGTPVVLEIDVEGARQVRRAVPDALLVFLAPPSRAELARRLAGRDTEPPEVIAERLAAADAELAAGEEFDVTLVNTSVEEVCRQLVSLMTLSAGRCAEHHLSASGQARTDSTGAAWPGHAGLIARKAHSGS